MEWNAKLYQDNHNFVTEYGKSLLEYIPDDKKQVVLDLGCGTGILTYELMQKVNLVIGIDSSEAMIQKSKETYPQIEFHVMDAYELIWHNYFDIVFSNAVFHWITNQKSLLESVCRALKTDGKLICEFGAHGNVAKIRGSFHNVLKKYGYDDTYPFYLPETHEYRELLESTGFYVELIVDYDRPTVLKDGKDGLRNWLKQFFSYDLLHFTVTQQIEIFKEIEDSLCSDLWDGEHWTADYRRIKVVALKNNGVTRRTDKAKSY